MLTGNIDDTSGTVTFTSPKGKFVTNVHVWTAKEKYKINDENVQHIVIYKEKYYKAKLLYYDEKDDYIIGIINCETEYFILNTILPRLGSTLIITGRPDLTSHQARVSKGILSHTDGQYYVSDAHADYGYSGGPVVDINKRLLGIVKGATTLDKKMIYFIPTLHFVYDVEKND